MIQLPEDIESEIALLATLGAPGNEQTASVEISALCDEDFHHPHHRLIFQGMRSLLSGGGEMAMVTLADTMRTAGTLERVGGVSTLVEILGAQDVSRPEVLSRILRGKRKQREIMALGHRLLQSAISEDPADLIADATSTLSRMAQTSGQGNVQEVGRFSDEALAQMLDRVDGRCTVGTRFHSWPRLNGLTHGFQPGQLIVLAARPGIGKTALALNWFLRAGMNGKRAVIFSLEMPKEELWNRLVSDKSGVDVRRMVEERDKESFNLFARGKMEVDELPLHVGDRAKITVSEIAAQVDRIITRHGSLGLLVIDYLQLLTSTQGGKNQTETIRIGEITRELKLLAKDRHVPILLLSQLNREVEKRGAAGRPQLSDLRDSGCIEQDSDLVMFIHRTMRATATELIIAKHRSGPCMTLPLSFRSEITRYIELERMTEGGGCPDPEPMSALQEDFR